MKLFLKNKYLITLLFVVLSFINLTYSYPCKTADNCPIKNRRIQYCNSAVTPPMVFPACACSLSQYGPPSFKPLKNKNIPICLEFEDTGVYNDDISMRGDLSGGETFTVYTKNNMLQDLENAVKAFKCICGLQEVTCKCTVKVSFSKNSVDLQGDLRLVQARTTMRYDLGNCEIMCNDAHIYINASDQYAGKWDDGYKVKAFCNQSYYDSDPEYYKNLRPGSSLINLTDLMLHEIGHIYGLDHQSTKYESLCPDPYDGEIMNTAIGANRHASGLSNDDMCLIKMLYCPDYSDVEEHGKIDENSDSYPNPSSDYILFNINSKVNNFDISQIEVYSIEGIRMNILKPIIVSEGKIKLDISNFQEGIYFIKIGNHTEKFVKIQQ